jgi:dCTP deaminase
VTVLCDWQIRLHCESSDAMVEPFRAELLNPASIDVLLGNNVMVEDTTRRQFIEVDISDNSIKQPFWIEPGEFCLAEIQEIVNLPDFLSGQFLLKSSRGREGYEHALAGFIDPGYRGRLTLELKNSLRHSRLPLYPGLKIGQIVFHRMCGTPLAAYDKTGRYNGDLKVTASRG